MTTDSRSTRIAVFIDFDNVEIGVKSTVGGQFDIGLVLEAIKERGEIVTKIAYSDFISLVEKLKQYGRKVIVVGGRQFTSLTMQKNCHEFIAYENLVNTSRPARERDRGGKQGQSDGRIATALPLIKRALKVLSEREVTPQLGLLKSTLLQLDSTFSERNYGASSFRDFMEKVAAVGVVVLRQSGRSMLVEATEDFLGETVEPVSAAPVAMDAPQPILHAPTDE